MKFKKFVYKKIKSTNLIAHKKIKSGYKSGIVIAELQTKGKGQYGKKWISIRGNVFLSIFLNLNKKILLKKITQYNCNLIKKSLKQFTHNKIIIKKPNDLLIKNQKFCGILQEVIKFKKLEFIIIGIGVNVVKSPDIYGYPTTYLNKYSTRKIFKDDVIKGIKKIFEKEYIYY